MAVRNKTGADQPRPDINQAAMTFHDIVDGADIFRVLDDAAKWFSEQGIEVISPRQGTLDDSYKPVSRIEKLLEKMFPGGGSNDIDDTFSIEKDGFETMVFEHGGQMYCSNWILDRESGRMEFIDMPDIEDITLVQTSDMRSFAKPTDEPITGDYARIFVGKPTWDAAVDFKVEGWPEFVGLRYKDFEASKAVHAKLDDGQTMSVQSIGIRRATQLHEGMDAFLKEARKSQQVTKKPPKGLSF